MSTTYREKERERERRREITIAPRHLDRGLSPRSREVRRNNLVRPLCRDKNRLGRPVHAYVMGPCNVEARGSGPARGTDETRPRPPFTRSPSWFPVQFDSLETACALRASRGMLILEYPAARFDITLAMRRRAWLDSTACESDSPFHRSLGRDVFGGIETMQLFVGAANNATVFHEKLSDTFSSVLCTHCTDVLV